MVSARLASESSAPTRSKSAEPSTGVMVSAGINAVFPRWPSRDCSPQRVPASSALFAFGDHIEDILHADAAVPAAW